jgi:hypothetical protein
MIQETLFNPINKPISRIDTPQISTNSRNDNDFQLWIDNLGPEDREKFIYIFGKESCECEKQKVAV